VKEALAHSLRQLLRYKALVLLALPGLLLLLLVFQYLPMVGLIIAFKDYRVIDGLWGSDWAGLDNFDRLFAGEGFFRAIRNTLVISFLRLALGFYAPIVLAILLNELRLAWYKRFIQTVTYIPHFLSWVILGGMFLLIFSANGPFNALLLKIAEEPFPFLTDDASFLAILILTGIWHGVGYGAVIYLAALAGISPSLYEAATVDGASRWRKIRHITLPGLVPTMIVLFILNLGHILNAGFDQIYNMYNPAVYDVADIIDTYVLRRLISLDFGLGTAAGLFKSLVGLVLVVGANSAARRLSGGEQGIF